MSRRSYLFVPGTEQSIIKKAIYSEADYVIIDLEDAVAFSEKDNARETVREALKSFSSEKNIIIRINDPATPFWELDLICAITYGAKGVMVPKSESEKGIRQVCDKARQFLTESQKDFEIIPLIESAKGVQFAYLVASADDMISRLAFGSIDFSLDIDCELTPGGTELLFARSQIVIASKAAGIGPPIDTVYPNLDNDKGLENETKIAKQLGYKGKLILHPKQIQTVHKVFSFSEKEINMAKEIVKAFEVAEKNGVASITVNSQLVDYPVYKKAKNILLIKY
ncbi:CoA ester lyase [Paenisporosarcina sp. TG20]|uniref:HpcH/HpaI aldolase/citrate lyase family protein n=1 Tax=Paenisporosarcina sp. TG20 TaxID=1211706 RepID=UPI000306A11A|nr:CoA ester lyase [Paenisporosarcina sp. TG20]